MPGHRVRSLLLEALGGIDIRILFGVTLPDSAV
jgi:hypothetical protein